MPSTTRYTMKDNESINLFDKINIDILIVNRCKDCHCWLLRKISIGTFNMHASTCQRRGRNPRYN